MNWTKLYAYGGAGVVGAVAAVVSFGHLRALALSAGESTLAAGLLPVSVDGLLVSAAAVMWMDNQAGRRARMSARVAFGTGCLATLAGNVASARPTVTGWLVAAWAPLALLLVTEMLARRGRSIQVVSPEPASVPESAPQRPARASGRGKAGSRRSAAARVQAARSRHPAATQTELARRLNISLRTVARHDPRRTDVPDPNPDGREHGQVPLLGEQIGVNE